jgi:hypothetical protein
VKYAWIARHKATWRITLTCEVLGVSTSGYFATPGYVSPITFEKRWIAAQQQDRKSA